MPMKARTVYFRFRRSKQSSIPTEPNQSFNWNRSDIFLYRGEDAGGKTEEAVEKLRSDSEGRLSRKKSREAPVKELKCTKTTTLLLVVGRFERHVRGRGKGVEEFVKKNLAHER